ncbi:TPA: arginine--tRNA ligase, partial [Candidatus Bathyarchaeota archaeon]|nr:arginine--tRNA ligase [Candidatus Bathyarchaeota archaeon]
EHTSVNPVHPIHIGQARNTAIGDAVARMLKARGHEVDRRYYVDDMGRQTAIAAYGYKKLGEPEIREKPDHFFGKIYSVTSCLLEIQKIKRAMGEIREEASKSEEYIELNRRLDEWVSIAAELKEKYPELFDKLSGALIAEGSSEEEVAKLIKGYELGEPDAKRLVRKVSELCLEGFKETLAKMEVEFDGWDWESDLVWGGEVEAVVKEISRSPYAFKSGGALELDVEKAVEELSLRDLLGVSPGYRLPSLTLARSDGTTLYITRDVAYTVKKFESADEVVNVIGAEQTLAQLQLKVALFCLGKGGLASKLKHLAFGLVELPGFKMSSRRGRLVTLDEVIKEAVRRARQEVSRRSPELPEEEKMEIAKKIGIGSIKYALLSVEPIKSVTFTWDRVLSFERNSAPFINYAYTRAGGILRKAGGLPRDVDGSLLTHPLEKELLLKVIKFPEVFKNSSDGLRPDDLANFANSLAEKFHEYYEKVDVIHVREEKLRGARLFLINAVRVVLKNSMELLGIKLAERM